MSLKKHFALAVLLFCGLRPACADVIQLKDQAAVTGKILAEKPDSIVVDVGYTVLVVPRNVIANISKSGNAAPTPTPAASNLVVSVNAIPQFFSSDNRPAAARDVQDLVKQIGEAVVQVRTPGGLGSGFFINADGYLITNFHVIEGETEISVEVYHQHNGQLDRETYKQVKIIAINKFHDLALLHIEDKNAPKFKFVTLGNADALTVGESVFAIGSP
ncbi:MAG: S1C family serine protease, partial [Limisphaerales bacterium]